MLFKYKGTDTENHKRTGFIRAENKSDALKEIKESTNIIVITHLKKQIDSPLLTPIRETVAEQTSSMRGSIQNQKATLQANRLEKKKQKIEKKRQQIYNPNTSAQSFAGIRKMVNDMKGIDLERFRPKTKPPVKDEETILDREAYYDLLDIFKEQEDEFDLLDLTPANKVIKPKEDKQESVIDWSLIDTEEDEEEGLGADMDKRFKVKVKQKDILMMTRRLQIMVSTGVSLVNALSILKDGEDDGMNMMLEKIIGDIQLGHSFSTAISQFPAQFDETYVSLVAIGETAGSLGSTLTDIVAMMEQKMNIQKKVKSASIYPSVIGVVLILVVVLASVFFIPAFEEMIMDTTGGDLPMITNIVFTAARYIPSISAVLGGTVFGFLALKSKNKAVERKFKEITHKWALKLPVVKKVVNLYQMHTFASVVALMLKNGISLSNALAMTKRSVSNIYIKNEIALSLHMMSEGYTLSEALNEQTHFDAILINLILVGEETGEMSFALSEIAKYYSDELERTVENMMAMIQPISILLIGAVAVPIIFAIYLPIMNMSSGAGM